MAVTKSWEASEELTTSIIAGVPKKSRRLRLPGLLWLLVASLLIGCGLALVYSAKIYRQHEPGAAQTPPLNLNAVTSAGQIVPYLQFYPSPQRREEVASALFAYIQQHRPLPNIGALSKMWARLQSADPSRLPLFGSRVSSRCGRYARKTASAATSFSGRRFTSRRFGSSISAGASAASIAIPQFCPPSTCSPASA